MQNRTSYFNGRSLFCGLGLSLILKNANTNFWISCILGTILGFLTLYFLKNKNENRIFKIISGFFFALISTSILTYISSTMYLNETPDFILALVSVLGVMIISKTRNASYVRATSMLFVFATALLVIASILLTKEINVQNLLPLGNASTKDTLYGALIFYLCSLTPVVSLNKIDNKKELLINYGLSTVSMIGTAFLVVSILGINESMLYRYPEYVVLKRIDVYNFFANVDNIFVAYLVIDLLVTASSSIKSMNLQNRISEIILFLALLLGTTIFSSNAKIATITFTYLPLMLIIILFPTLIAKKRKYKRDVKIYDNNR